MGPIFRRAGEAGIDFSESANMYGGEAAGDTEQVMAAVRASRDGAARWPLLLRRPPACATTIGALALGIVLVMIGVSPHRPRPAPVD